MTQRSDGLAQIVARARSIKPAIIERGMQVAVLPDMQGHLDSTRPLLRTIVLLWAAAVLAGCASLGGPDGTHGVYQRGEASWYGKRFDGRRTASGERFRASRLTAAHPSLAFGTRVRVTNEANGRSVAVRINDRGPHARGRVIDLSRAAAARLHMIRSGVAPVSLRLLD